MSLPSASTRQRSATIGDDIPIDFMGEESMITLALRTIFTVVLAVSALLTGSPAARAALQLDKVELPPGFKIEVYADNIPGARQMVLSENGTLFVGTRFNKGSGKVYAVLDRNKDNKADQVITIANDLFMPNGVEFKKGSLYVAEVDRILRFDDIESKLSHPPTPVVVFSNLPHDTHHGWKYIRFGPEGLLYVPVGAPCNVCMRPDPYAGLSRIKADGTNFEMYCRGIRNTVGFDWDPVTKQLWFTDNGRDWLGDDLPPDELNHAPKAGMHFGFPFRYGNNIPDPEFGAKAPAGIEFTPPAQCLDAHVASLGMRFYTGKMFPPEYRNQIFIAEHGSWNRSKPDGCRVSLVKISQGKAVSYKPFATGFQLADGNRWGRPVDLLVMPDGALLLSDDFAGAIYRISYQKSQ